MVHKALEEGWVGDGDHVVGDSMFLVMIVSVKAASLAAAGTLAAAAAVIFG
ncbi:hypothetical protein GCM10023213_37000 [Prosthecobacter algae]|uniref:Uncharacterized protein n=1 Tax=Prosthecobacter algae TaxID=1144682 RepID=A0ABP9PEN9_9BACT